MSPDLLLKKNETLFPHINNGLVFIAGKGADNIEGRQHNDKLDGGDGNDSLYGVGGDDVFIGGRGNDRILGDPFLFSILEGTDSSIYEGKLDEYDIEFLADDSVKITDRVGDRDGSDLLIKVEQAVFSDKTIDISPGQDLSLIHI